MGNPPPLPTFLRPMLAQPGRPFDSDQHLFEIKWDGIRALAFVEEGGYRLVSRHGLALDALFPELAGIAHLPPGTLLDGELVVLRQGRPDLSLIQSRHQLRSPHKIRIRAQTTPATYIVFDQLYDEYRPLLGRPLSVRRDILCSNLRKNLRKNLGRAGPPRLVFSQGVLGAGRAFFQLVVDRQLEGVVAKRLDSLYRPGRRDGAWIKIKPSDRSLKVYPPGGGG
jgi:ATP-dependent DNA ligase